MCSSDLKIDSLKKLGKVVYVGDVVGTGSSRKSACNSIMWHFGDDMPFIPNKRSGGVVIGGVIAPIFFNTCQDSGSLPIIADVSNLKNKDLIDIYQYRGIIERDGEVVSRFSLTPNTIFDEMRAGGRIPLIIGRGLTDRARAFLKMGESDIFQKATQPDYSSINGYTLAQKIVGRACGKDGVIAGEYCDH